MRKVVLAFVLSGLTAIIGAARGETPAKTDRPADSSKAGVKKAFLGVRVESMPSALSSQMAGVVPKGEGLLVEHVAKDSPAAKAGLKSDDILLSYGEQKLHSPEQLLKLVREGKPGQAVSLGFVRGGKADSCKATLGERMIPTMPDRPRVFHLRPDQRLRDMFTGSDSKKDNQTWESFDALKLTRLDAKKWRAEIEFRSDKGKKEHKTFEGTREQLRKDIQAEKDLPTHERGHLLRALNLEEPVFEFQFPPFDTIEPNFGEQP